MNLKKLTINELVLKVDESDFKSFELRFGISLPSEFKEFINLYGGAYPIENVFEQSKCINFFLDFRSADTLSVESIFETYLEEYETQEWLPFAMDPGGYVFVLALDRDNEVWIHKYSSGEDDPFYFVAESLEFFINGLEEEL